MNRIERILEEWGWVFRIILVIVWFLWAIQLWGLIKQGVQEKNQYQKSRDIRQEMNYNREVGILAVKKVEAAKAAGTSYGPRQYFQDLREINEKVMKYNIPAPMSYVDELLWLSRCNVIKKHFTWEDVNTAQKEYMKWQEEHPGPLEKSLRQSKQPIWLSVWNWFLALYLRSMLLSLIFYLIRMAERKGILQTILADKKKFVLATAGWIYYFFKYPNNVIREVVVEAELRRIGGLFRRLSHKEIALVKQVANSTSYKEWLAAFRTHRPVRFQRSLLIAVLGTIILYILSPTVNASITPLKHKQVCKAYTYGAVFLNKASPTTKADLAKVNQKQEKLQKFCPEKWITINDYVLFGPLPLLRRINQKIVLLMKSELIYKIDHIPVIDYLVSRLTKTLNQIVGGICFLRLKSGGNKNEESIYLRGHIAVGA